MRLRPRPIWVLVLLMLGLLIVLNRASLQSLHQEDAKALAQRSTLARRLDSLEVRVHRLERRP